MKPFSLAIPELGLVEYTMKHDSGIRLNTGEPWEGFRIRYRQTGRRFWLGFLLETETGIVTSDQVALAISAHEQRKVRS